MSDNTGATPAQRLNLQLFAEAHRHTDLAGMESVSAAMRAEQARIAGMADSEYTVALYEDGGGNLYLIRDGAAAGYIVTDLQEQASFEEDAVALLSGDTDDWTTPPFDATDGTLTAPETRRVAAYDGATGEVGVVGQDGRLHALGAIPDDGIVAGYAGRAYIGPLHYVSDGERV